LATGGDNIIEVNLKARPAASKESEAKYVLVKFKPDSWQGKVLTAMEANNFQVATTFRPIVDECLLDIGRQLEIPETLSIIAAQNAEAAAKLAAGSAAQ
jgi:hypothetical protein